MDESKYLAAMQEEINNRQPVDVKLMLEKLLVDYYELSKKYLALEKRFEEASLLDPLTKVTNRLQMLKQVRHEWSRSVRYHSTSSLIMIDVDDFKRVNRSFGTEVGNQIMIQFVNVLNKNIRGTDYFGRLEGDRYLIIVGTTNNEQAAWLANKLKSVIEATDFMAGVHLTCSFGVADREAAMDADDWVKIAEIALSQAKEAGGNQVVDFETIKDE